MRDLGLGSPLLESGLLFDLASIHLILSYITCFCKTILPPGALHLYQMLFTPIALHCRAEADLGSISDLTDAQIFAKPTPDQPSYPFRSVEIGDWVVCNTTITSIDFSLI